MRGARRASDRGPAALLRTGILSIDARLRFGPSTRTKRDLSARHYVYFWADGIHVQERAEAEGRL